ncbi:MAG TPA: histidinol dehydrogenase [archaeon]|nr:histidinol dehydrogenase [archaeon]
MIKIIQEKGEDFLADLARRKAEDLDRVTAEVSEIIRRVRKEGDRALVEFTRRFDKVSLAPERFRVTDQEIDRAESSLDTGLKKALSSAYKRICDYHGRQLANSWFTTGPDGEILGQRILPVESAAIYAPGGKAAYPSSVLMGAGAARTAGVKRLVLLSPPDPEGGINPAVLFAARTLGKVDEIYRLGGAHAIAAAAYGTESLRPVDVIAGPGNIYVTAAKKLVYGTVNIDMLAGPSEILVIADSSARPAWIAADLLSQAEHDERSACCLVTTSSDLAGRVQKELEAQLERLPKKEIAAQAIQNFGAILLARDLDEAAFLANLFAPEHLELLVADPWSLLGRIQNAGAVFLGPYTPEAVGDYWAGPNHVLPTGGSAKNFSPLGVEVFLKRSSLISFNRPAFERALKPVTLMARAEGLEAHARSMEIRKEK